MELISICWLSSSPPLLHTRACSEILTRVAAALNEVERILNVSYWHLICICKWDQSVQTQESRNNVLQIGSCIKHSDKHGVILAQLQHGGHFTVKQVPLFSPNHSWPISEISVWKCRKYERKIARSLIASALLVVGGAARPVVLGRSWKQHLQELHIPLMKVLGKGSDPGSLLADLHFPSFLLLFLFFFSLLHIIEPFLFNQGIYLQNM